MHYTEFCTSAQAVSMVTGSDGAVWVLEANTDHTEKIARFTPAGVTHEYSLPALHEIGSNVTRGPDGALWFTGFSRGRGATIGRITTSGDISMYPAQSVGAALEISAGPDGALWFAIQYGGVGRITTSGTITTYCTGCFGHTAQSIVGGPDGAIWMTVYGQIRRITTTGAVDPKIATSPRVSPTMMTQGLMGRSGSPSSALTSDA